MKNQIDPQEKRLDDSEVKLSLSALMECVAQARSGLSLDQISDVRDDETLKVFAVVLASPRPWNLKRSVLGSLITMLEGSTFNQEELPNHLAGFISGLPHLRE